MNVDPMPLNIDTSSFRAAERLASLRKALPQFENNERKYTELWIQPSRELMRPDQKNNFGSMGQNLTTLSQNVLDFRDNVLCPLIRQGVEEGLQVNREIIMSPLRQVEGRKSILEYGYSKAGFSQVFTAWEERVNKACESVKPVLKQLIKNLCYSDNFHYASHALAGGNHEALQELFRHYSGHEDQDNFTKDELLDAVKVGIRLETVKHAMFSIRQIVNQT